MPTQIAIPIDVKTKTSLQNNLKKRGLTTKAFILSCIYAFNNGDLSLGIISHIDPDTILTHKEKITFYRALRRYKIGRAEVLENVMSEK